MYSIRNFSIAAALALSYVALPTAASASTLFNFPMTSNGGGDGSGRTYNVAVGSITVKVRVTAWSVAGTTGSGTITKGAVQSYSSGLGISSAGESLGSPHHTIDNLTNRDFLIFQFDQPVEMESAKFTTYNMGNRRFDGDATIAFGNTASSWQADLLASSASYAQLQALFGTSFEASSAAATRVQDISTRSLNGGDNAGNIWLIGAAFSNSAERNCNRSANQTCLDGFKLSNVAVSAVPEPAAWLMMILGFGFVGFSLRRKNADGTNRMLKFA